MRLSYVLRTKHNALKLSTKSLEQFINRIQADTKDGAVARRREYLRISDHIAEYDNEYPSHLIYPSVEWERDENDNLKMRHFNGVVALTVDGLSPAGLEAVKQAAQILHYTLAAFVGPTGREVIILVRIGRDEAASEPQQPLTEEEAERLCSQGYELAASLYQGILPHPVVKEKGSLHTCFRMPLDVRPYLNAKALPLPVSMKPLGVHATSDTSLAVSQQQEETPSAEPSETSIEARQLIDFLNERYAFRFNTIMDYTEYRSKERKYSDWQPIDKRALYGLAMTLRLGGIDARENDVRRYVQSDMILPYDPVGEYLWAQYGKWDGKDHIRRLARTVPTKNPHWENWFYTWFLGMVRQWQVTHLAKYGNQSVPLLISTQGWNKTTFCEQLLPPELSWGYTGNMQMSDKRQVLQQMAQMLLVNLDEFNQFSPKLQQGFLKNIITLSSVKIKRPYGKHVEDFPRRASFIATTNQTDVLADPSGNRRFLGVQLSGPIDVTVPPNHEQLYAQAMHALHQHEPYFFGPEETEQIILSNRQFCLLSAADMFFLDYFEPADDENEGTWTSATAIFEFLKSKVGVSVLRPASVSAFGRRLSNMKGLKKRETSRHTEYLVKQIKS